jgi:membrane glycosyltransferase
MVGEMGIRMYWGDRSAPAVASCAVASGAGNLSPALHPSIRARRRFVLALNGLTVLGLLAAMVAILAHGGLMPLEVAMLTAYALTLPWLAIGFWNAVIGFVLDWRHGTAAATAVNPALARVTEQDPIRHRVAIVMALRNEDPQAAIARVQSLQQALARTSWGHRFHYHVLSDSDRPEIAEQEERRVAQWRMQAGGSRIHYRRRRENAGYKSGNIAEFVQSRGPEYEYFLPLDADSVMGPDIVLRMVRVMQASPEIGMLQSLVTGMPSATFFSRAFQFGMRHGMRSFTLGSAWWQADCGPNWGHNVLVRTAPFRESCMLPDLPGSGPFAGPVLSHDQMEAVLMRRAGYEIRVIAQESDSHEQNPPSLTDFIRRELRWCNGNLQYLRLIGLPGLKATSRIQLLLAILMYASPLAWMTFILLGAVLAGQPAQFEAMLVTPGLALFAGLMTLNLSPKLLGLAQAAGRAEEAARYGGRSRLIAGGAAEVLFGILLAPIIAAALTIFVLGLFFGRRIGWDVQQRQRERLEWGGAARVLWPQTLIGIALALWLAATAPWALAYAAPVLLSLAGAVPIAVLSTHPAAGRWTCAVGLFDIPEDRRPLRFALQSVFEPDCA